METTVREIEVVSETQNDKINSIPTIKSLIKETVLWYKKNFKTIFNIFFIPAILMVPLVFFDSVNDTSNGYFGTNAKFIGAALAIVFILQAFLNIVATIGFIKKVPTFKTITPHWIDVYKDGLKFLIPFVLVGIIQFLVVFSGFVLLIIPGLILSFYFVFSMYALMIDDKKGIDALVHSAHLIRSNLFSVAIRLIVLGFLTTLIIVLATILVNMLTFYLPGILPDFMISISSPFVELIVLSPMIVIYNNIMYEALSKNSKEIEKPREIKYKKVIKALMILSGVFIATIVILFISFA